MRWNLLRTLTEEGFLGLETTLVFRQTSKQGSLEIWICMERRYGNALERLGVGTVAWSARGF